jgi:RNA polymerase sigma-70 factor (ECF subfamily)
MLNVARRMLKNDAAAADSVQEAFISAFANIDKFESRSTLKTWLHRIVVNKCLMQLRSKKQKAEDSLDKWMPSFDNNNCRIEEPWTRLLSADEICESRQLSTAVQTAIQDLPEHFRIVLHLRDIEGFSTAEVAENLGITESNVKVRLHRGRSALKLILEPVLRGHIS